MSKVCIIIPCYNESERLDTRAFADFMQLYRNEYDLLFVNDGSTDQTLSVLHELAALFPEAIFVHDLVQNSGKAEAVRQGVLLAAKKNVYDYIAYFDADLATPLTEIVLMKKIIADKPELVLVLCSRIKRLGGNVERKPTRHYLGRIFSTFASNILQLPVYDTQCGAKLIKTSSVTIAFEAPFITSWIFDVEILARIRNANKNTIKEILHEHPVTMWKDIGGSKLKLKHMIKVPFELLKIKRKYN